MPVYEFVCRGCRLEFEITRSMSDFNPRNVRCPDCGSRAVDRRWGGVVALTKKKS